MTHSNPVVLKLEGGLGNQLFEFAAGYYLSAKLDCDLHLDQYSIPLTTVHGEIRAGFEPFINFSLPNGKKIEFLSPLPGKLITHLANRSKFFKKVAIKLRMFSSNPNKLPLFIESNQTESLNSFLDNTMPMKLHGNFQSWTIVERAAEFGFPKSLTLRNRPDWIVQLETEIDFRDSAVLHFRVGDDTRTNSNFKQPEISYYLSALNILELRKTFRGIYVLSDDISRVKKMFGDKLNGKFEYLEMPRHSSPAERLYVLSLFGAIVCANSTFCGWAAWSISNSGGEVVVPVPYSDGHVLGSRDFPSNWIQLDKYSGEKLR